MDLISFAHVADYVRAREKTVTRRYNMWKDLKPGTQLRACVKTRGVRRENQDELAAILVTDVRFEPLRRMLDEPRYGRAEIRREGFAEHPELHVPAAWVTWFCQTHRGCTPDSVITRLEFEYVDILASSSVSGDSGRGSPRTRRNR